MGVVTDGILNMPFDMAMADKLSQRQFYDTVRSEIKDLRAALSQAEPAGGAGQEGARVVRPLPKVGEEAEVYRQARGPEWAAVFDALRDYNLSNMCFADDASMSYPLVDLLSRDGEGVSIADGEFEMVAIADEIITALRALSPAPAGVQVKAEPVAWQYRWQNESDGEWSGWIVTELDPNDWTWPFYWKDLETRPLYAAPPAAREPVAMGVFRDGKMIGFVGLGEEYRLEDDTDVRAPIYATPPAAGVQAVPVDPDALAQEIRRVDGSHSLGACQLAEALVPFLSQQAVPPHHPYEDWRAAINFAIENDEPQAFLKCWNEGDWETLDDEWPEWGRMINAASPVGEER